VAFGGSGGDGDGRAVHVHLAVTDLVEPGPGENGIASWDVGDGEGVCGWAVSGCVVASVTGDTLDWAASFDGVDDFEDAVFGWGFVVGD